MKVLYTGDNEGPTVIDLEQLIGNFNVSGGWEYRHNEEDMRHELESRGWYAGLHENGHYLVINFSSKRMQLMPHPDCPEEQPLGGLHLSDPQSFKGEKRFCQHRSDGRGRCIDCGEFI